MLINASTRELFTYKDACIELNPHVGDDAAATEAAKTSVKQFYQQCSSFSRNATGTKNDAFMTSGEPLYILPIFFAKLV